MEHSAKSLWKRFALGLRYGDRRLINSLYWFRDPWNMESPRETFRFEETNRLIAERFGRVGRLLELGCGEGHHSEHLLQLCDSLYGIDLSPRAVARAKSRTRAGSFGAGDIFSAEIVRGAPSFDLVVACEVLYYMQDIPAVLNRMSQIGNACFVTYYEGQSERLDPLFRTVDQSQTTTFSYDSTHWRAIWWRGALPTSGHHQQ